MEYPGFLLNGLVFILIGLQLLGIEADGAAEREELEVRVRLAQQSLAYLGGPEVAALAPARILGRMQPRYRLRLERRASGGPDGLPEITLTPFQKLQEVLIHFEREQLNQLRREQRTREEALRKLENELNLEEDHLALDKA